VKHSVTFVVRDCVFGVEDNALIPKDKFEDTEDVFNGE
jgi:hypothetical protein